MNLLSVGEIESTVFFLQTLLMLATCLSSLKTITSITHVQKIYSFNPVKFSRRITAQMMAEPESGR